MAGGSEVVAIDKAAGALEVLSVLAESSGTARDHHPSYECRIVQRKYLFAPVHVQAIRVFTHPMGSFTGVIGLRFPVFYSEFTLAATRQTMCRRNVNSVPRNSSYSKDEEKCSLVGGQLGGSVHTAQIDARRNPRYVKDFTKAPPLIMLRVEAFGLQITNLLD